MLREKWLILNWLETAPGAELLRLLFGMAPIMMEQWLHQLQTLYKWFTANTGMNLSVNILFSIICVGQVPVWLQPLFKKLMVQLPVQVQQCQTLQLAQRTMVYPIVYLMLLCRPIALYYRFRNALLPLILTSFQTRVTNKII